MGENVENVADTLYMDLIVNGPTYNEPNQHLYQTTLGLIFILHIIFVIQWKLPRNDIVVTYQQIIKRKQYHRLIVGMLSHPCQKENTIEPNIPAATTARASSWMRNFNYDIESAGGINNGILRGNVTLQTRVRACASKIVSLLNRHLLHPLVYGNWSGLPLLTYVSHILWQCRPLEEVYDYMYDSDDPHLHHEAFNITSIIDKDIMLQNAILQNAVKKISTSRMVYKVEYYRILFALAMCSSFLEMITNYLILRYLRTRSMKTSTVYNYILNRGLCTLSPMCTAMIVIYISHFPHTPISAIPFIDTRFILGSSSQLTFILCLLILSILSYRIYPVSGVFYGSISGLLWTSGLIHFLADEYWGGWLIFLTLIASALSLKFELSQVDTNNMAGESRAFQFKEAMLLWIDYVSWHID